MIFENIYNEIKSSFNSLWQFKERGKTLEIITPFATTSHKFVSVFLSIQENKYIVTDGGWVQGGYYETAFNQEEDCFRKALYHYQNSFNIKEVNTPSGIYFYKSTDKEIAVPSLIFDIANFISSMISLSEIEYSEKLEKETKERFRSMANDFLIAISGRYSVDFRGYLDDQDKRIKMHAIIKKPHSKLILVNYITGSTNNYFLNSIGRANLMFEMAEESLYSPYIDKKVCFIDDTAIGYSPKVIRDIDFIVNNTNSHRADWSTRENYISLFQ